mgnify:CR=1 FL=1
MKKSPKNRENSSFEDSAKWYDSIVGSTGHLYHRSVIFPKLKSYIEEKKYSSILDLACGQGAFCQTLPRTLSYTGIDLSPSLIKSASQRHPYHQWHIADVTKSLPIQGTFDCVLCILALQNIADPAAVFVQAKKYLSPQGSFIIVLNHPCFRIPRQSSWAIAENGLQYRRIDRYATPMEIPIFTHPSKKEESTQTVSFHHPLSSFSQFAYKAGLSIHLLEEWHSPLKSEGKFRKRENRAREEFPLFCTLYLSSIANSL